MYWQEFYKSPAHAAAALALDASGKRSLTPAQRHVAHVAVRSNLSGLTEAPHLGGNFGTNLTVEGQLSGDYEHLLIAEGQLGSLKSFLKKVVKTANKLDPLYSVRKKIDPVTKAVDRAVGIKSSAPKSVPALVSEAPATAVLPNAPAQPIPELSTTSPMSFSQGSGGGGGSPAPVPGDTAVAEDSGLSMPVMIGIGVAGLVLLYLLTRKH